ncbi:amidohydrolase [bacterium]|nr:amidohydrolase [bacterium]
MNSKTTLFPARKIITMNATRPEGTAVAVRDGMILGVGSLEEMKSYGPFEVDNKFEDLILIPGLIEAHSHIGEGTHWGFPYIGYYDRVGPDGRKWKGLKDFEEVLTTLKMLDHTMTNPDEPLVVWGFDPIFFEKDWLNVSHLDRISKKRPIFVFHISDHLATVNTALMSLMNITKDTAVEGVDIGANGELTGELREPYALRLAGDIYLKVADGAQIDRNWLTYGIQAKNAGCTTIAEMAYGSPGDQAALNRLKRLIDAPDYPVRIAQLYLPMLHDVKDHDEAAQWVIKQGQQSSKKLRLGIIKYFLDGSIQGFTARLRKPGYHNGNPNGMWLTPPEEMVKTLLSYHRHGLNMHCHCNGDEAVDVFLDAVERVQAEKPWLDHRHTIHHSQLTSPAQYRRMARLGVSANIFSNHIYYWGDKHYETTVGPDRAHRMNACQTAKQMGVHFSMHSDAPITPISQIHSVWAAVNRQTSSGRVLGEHERLSVYDALYAVTLDAAYTLKMDQDVGSIEPGKLADFTVLEKNPFDVDPLKIKDIPVWGTVLGGEPFPAAR